ncbi:di-/tricarboxylate transporter [Halovivax ruber XH-70]|uniref:Di-/tricarboxylate transporter n=2 Tax=Halovivax ruber TaxID=387341 RepID=L0IFT1_HALRX|nr:SLC13 family permease [Halovivax ruber]AGB17703.1 di-/tricarboxylate transporter [Halovivax ruber XH-70]
MTFDLRAVTALDLQIATAVDPQTVMHLDSQTAVAGLTRPLAAQPVDTPSLSPAMLVVFAIVVVAVVLFVTQPVPLDVTALGVIVALVVLEPWTTISPEEGISGFASPATITVLMMFVLSEGIRRTGAVQLLGERMAAFAGDSDRRQLGSIVGVSGLSAGFVNNTPVVAIMIPVVIDLAERTGTSPSRLLIPLSYASMLGGMLTLIGTSTNILASSIVARDAYLGRPFSMFEFTALGVLVLATGSLYLLLVAPALLPERIEPSEALTDEFDVSGYLTEVTVPTDSPLVGTTVHAALEAVDVDLEAVTLLRGEDAFGASIDEKELRPADVLIVRTGREGVIDLAAVEGLSHRPRRGIDEADLEITGDENGGTEQRLAEVIVAPDGDLVGETLESTSFRQRYGATVLALRRGPDVFNTRMDLRPLRGGDTLLVQADHDALDRLGRNRNVIVAQEFTRPTYRREKLPLALGIVAGVVGLAALDVQPILVTAIAGAGAMVTAGILEPRELWDGVDWSVIVLLAGLIPLGIALEETGAAAFLAGHAVAAVGDLHVVFVLGLLYLGTALLTELLSNNASVVLMIPIGFDVAIRLGADPYAFVLAVVFACSTPLLSPVGYQTNLMVYGPGGYEFTDFARVGAPLQVLLAVVTTLGIVVLWGV